MSKTEIDDRLADEAQHDEGTWVKEPTESIHGIRVVGHEGMAFIEQVNDSGEDVQSIMIDEDEVEGLINALGEVLDDE